MWGMTVVAGVTLRYIARSNINRIRFMLNMTVISQLANKALDERELQLAEHLAFLLDDDKWDAASLIGSIIPVYWERVDERDRTLDPDNVFRSLYYIHVNASVNSKAFRRNTRAYMIYISNHIEGCLQQLMLLPRNDRGLSKTFGPLVAQLKKKGILPEELTGQLWEFNDAINVPSKHLGAYIPTRRLKERTFSVIETAWALILMRKLSMQLFDLLITMGRPLPKQWPVFKDEWLTWAREVQDNSDTR